MAQSIQCASFVFHPINLNQTKRERGRKKKPSQSYRYTMCRLQVDEFYLEIIWKRGSNRLTMVCHSKKKTMRAIYTPKNWNIVQIHLFTLFELAPKAFIKLVYSLWCRAVIARYTFNRIFCRVRRFVGASLCLFFPHSFFFLFQVILQILTVIIGSFSLCFVFFCFNFSGLSLAW